MSACGIAIVEVQTEGGVWIKFCDGSSHPSSVSRMLAAALSSQRWVKKARAIDAETRQIIDMAFR